ncbi:hypothetical protein DFJ74DRAFT_767338 [Hyaloraphidium curvatum]|nr:hypothetical protein DFJ74DRAFT_767338 [Hyaloraphidium curvatum]
MEPAEPDAPVLLPEIVALIADALAARGLRRTLLRLALSSREVHANAMPSLLREVTIAAPAFTPRRAAAFLNDCMAAGGSAGRADSQHGEGFREEHGGGQSTEGTLSKFRHVRRLRIAPTGYEGEPRFEWPASYAALLKACLPYVRHLSVRFFRRDAQLLRDSLLCKPGPDGPVSPAPNLAHLDLACVYVHNLIADGSLLPPTLQTMDLELDSDLDASPLLSTMDRAPRLAQVRLWGAWWPHCVDLARFPSLAARVVALRADCEVFQRPRLLPPMPLRELSLAGAGILHGEDRAWLASLGSLARLELMGLSTSDPILRDLPPNLERLVLVNPACGVGSLSESERRDLRRSAARVRAVVIRCRAGWGDAEERSFWALLEKPPRFEIVY